MTTCFIFLKNIEDETLLSLRLDAKGQVDVPLAPRSVSELQLLQENAQTIMVLPATQVSLHLLELPWLGERKSLLAIPYALEEQLAQPVETLHFAFDKQHHHLQHYLVVVMDRALLEQWLERFKAQHLSFHLFTIDWFSLNENERSVTDSALLVNDASFKGALSEELLSAYLNQKGADLEYYVFKDSLKTIKPSNITRMESSWYEWMAKRLLVNRPMNLCQGPFSHDKAQKTCRRWYQGLASLLGAWVLVSLVFQGFYLHALKKQVAATDAKIAEKYRVFFPKAKLVISPKFRIQQLMKGNSTGASEFWSLLDRLGSAYSKGQYKIQELRYQNQKMSVRLVSPDFSSLEQFQKKLEDGLVKVSQSSAQSETNHVVATLELSL